MQPTTYTRDMRQQAYLLLAALVVASAASNPNDPYSSSIRRVSRFESRKLDSSADGSNIVETRVAPPPELKLQIVVQNGDEVSEEGDSSRDSKNIGQIDTTDIENVLDWNKNIPKDPDTEKESSASNDPPGEHKGSNDHPGEYKGSNDHPGEYKGVTRAKTYEARPDDSNANSKSEDKKPETRKLVKVLRKVKSTPKRVLRRKSSNSTVQTSVTKSVRVVMSVPSEISQAEGDGKTVIAKKSSFSHFPSVAELGAAEAEAVANALTDDEDRSVRDARDLTGKRHVDAGPWKPVRGRRVRNNNSNNNKPRNVRRLPAATDFEDQPITTINALLVQDPYESALGGNEEDDRIKQAETYEPTFVPDILPTVTESSSYYIPPPVSITTEVSDTYSAPGPPYENNNSPPVNVVESQDLLNTPPANIMPQQDSFTFHRSPRPLSNAVTTEKIDSFPAFPFEEAQQLLPSRPDFSKLFLNGLKASESGVKPDDYSFSFASSSSSNNHNNNARPSKQLNTQYQPQQHHQQQTQYRPQQYQQYRPQQNQQQHQQQQTQYKPKQHQPPQSNLYFDQKPQQVSGPENFVQQQQQYQQQQQQQQQPQKQQQQVFGPENFRPQRVPKGGHDQSDQQSDWSTGDIYSWQDFAQLQPFFPRGSGVIAPDIKTHGFPSILRHMATYGRSLDLAGDEDAVDFGAATGGNGAFGWYSDHPTQQH